jgi:hypothetical protein
MIMKTFFQSFSLGGGALLIAVVSALLACLLARVRSAAVRWTAAVVLPFILSYCLYWAPVWLGATGDQYFSWVFLGVGVGWVAGVIASAIVILVLGRRQNTQRPAVPPTPPPRRPQDPS